MESAVKWIHYSEASGEPLSWTKWHYIPDSYQDKTACGVDVPRGDDRLLIVDFDYNEVTCDRCIASIEKRDKAKSRDESDQIVWQTATSKEPPFGYGAFTTEEVKKAAGLDGRKVAASLARLGFKRFKSGLWRQSPP